MAPGKKPLPIETPHQQLLVDTAIATALLLAEIHRQGNWQEQTKADNSPVTDADLAADKLIAERLRAFAIAQGVQIISEETATENIGGNVSGEDSASGDSAQSLLLVDPLDGTRNFMQFGHDYCVNIGLVENGQASFGVVADPADLVCWWGGSGYGAWRASFASDGRLEDKVAIRVSSATKPPRIVLGYWSKAERVAPRLAKLGFEMTKPQRVGAALKFCRIAEGVADLYPRGAGSSEWDTAAGQAILEGAGGLVRLVRHDGTISDQTLLYGKDKFLNPPFFAASPDALKKP